MIAIPQFRKNFVYVERDYPLYLHITGEYREEDYWALLSECKTIHVRRFLSSVMVESPYSYDPESYFSLSDECTEGEFMEAYQDVMKSIAL